MALRLHSGLRFVALAAALTALSSVALAPARDPADIALGKKIPSVNFDAVALSDALDFLRDVGGLSLHVDWKVLEAAGVDKTATVTFHLRGITVRKALDTVLREAGSGTKLAYDIDEGVIEITTQDESDKKLVTEVYDVRDLEFTPIDAGDPPEVQFQLDAVTRGGGGGGGGGGGSGGLFGGNNGGGAGRGPNGGAAKTPEQKGDDLVQIVTSLIRPEVWNINGGPASIRYYNHTLIVTAPKSVQELIGTPISVK